MTPDNVIPLLPQPDDGQPSQRQCLQCGQWWTAWHVCQVASTIPIIDFTVSIPATDIRMTFGTPS